MYSIHTHTHTHTHSMHCYMYIVCVYRVVHITVALLPGSTSNTTIGKAGESDRSWLAMKYMYTMHMA